MATDSPARGKNRKRAEGEHNHERGDAEILAETARGGKDFS